MRIEESFVVRSELEIIWAFFTDVTRVCRCIPGFESVTVLGPDRYRVVAHQKVGFITATFEVTTHLEASEPMKFMQFASVGRTLRGAVGNLRTRDRVEFEVEEAGATRVRLLCDAALGGALGALGNKVVIAKSRELTVQFAKALHSALGGDDGFTDPAAAAASKGCS